MWPAVVQILQANGVDLSGVPPTAADVGTTLRALDPSIGAFRDQSAGLRDIAPLRPTITRSFELGYKGLLGRGLLLDVSVYTTRRTNFRGPLAVETPSVFSTRPICRRTSPSSCRRSRPRRWPGA